MSAKTSKKRVKRIVPEGYASISAGFNNTIISITDLEGGVLCWQSAGSSGYKGTRKSTPYAAQMAAEKVAEKAKVYGLERVFVKVTGIGPGREQAIRGLYLAGIDITGIVDVTPVPHNGCRKPRVRRN